MLSSFHLSRATHKQLVFRQTSCLSRFYSSKMSQYTPVIVGKPDTSDYKVYIKGPNGVVSAVHDIPLQPEGADKRVFNMVVEVPRWSNAKLEVCIFLKRFCSWSISLEMALTCFYISRNH